jgi:ribokinase
VGAPAAVSNSVIVVGSVNVDLVLRVERLPSPGETVSGGTFLRTPGGKGANQAAAAARLGARTSLVGLTGDDEFGRLARDDLAGYGVDASGLGLVKGSTGVAAILVDAEGENLIAVAPGANHKISAADVSAHLERLASPGSVVLTVLELPDEAISAAAQARALGCLFVLNPAPARPLPREVLERCDVLTPNELEVQALGGIDALLALGVGAVVITRGAEGADVHLSGEQIHIEAFPAEVVDTTGAGDAFNGTLAWALADGHTLDDAVRLAVGAGALATRALGARAALADRDELEALVGL